MREGKERIRGREVKIERQCAVQDGNDIDCQQREQSRRPTPTAIAQFAQYFHCL